MRGGVSGRVEQELGVSVRERDACGWRGTEIWRDGRDVIRIRELENLLASDGGRGSGWNKPALHPMKQLAGWATGDLRWDIGVHHHNCVGSEELLRGADSGRAGGD